MSLNVPGTPSASRLKAGPSTKNMAPPPSSGRMTRLRAAKDTASPAVLATKTPSLLSRGKEGFRSISEKIKEKEKDRDTGKGKAVAIDTTNYSETLKAFLRIRPSPPDAAQNGIVRPYLELTGEKEVIMRAPVDPSRPHMPKPPHIYSFDHVFPPSTSQISFFAETTLPLVDKLLKGENGLVFAYGVSNSGKSYSISGGNNINQEDRGVLPRAIDVVFNSIEGLESKVNLRCTGLADVELTGVKDPKVLDGFFPEFEGTSSETCKVDRNFSYAVFVSYSEVYNEKIFDLLDSILPISAHGKNGLTLPRPSSHLAMPGGFGSSMSLAAIANGGGGIIKRKALSLKNDPEGNGKYIAGLSEIRVRTRQEALAVFRSGQRARQVFGTLANRESSRSHGIFTVKVVRIHNGAPEDPDSAQVSRLAIVDLAGSERMRNTGTSGDRLKEAGNINKSLMVLGQCLEVLRSNQQSMAAPVVPGRKKKLAVVPFRHSKLTEIFQNFFVGDGRAVMIVHVNPYDTGFDENSHVMRFSAIARDIQTTASNKVGFPLLKRQISTQFSALRQAVSGPMKVKVVVPVLPKPETASGNSTAGKAKVVVGRERESDGYVLIEEELEVVEEDDSESEGEDEPDWMVEHLFEQLREARQQLYESEMRNATIEADVREEAALDMQEALQKMHAEFTKLLSDQVAASELKADRKLDILSRAIPTPMPQKTVSLSPASFAGEVDDSMEASQGAPSSKGGRMSDPFLLPSTSTTSRARQTAKTEEGDESDDDLEDEEEVIQALKSGSRQGSEITSRVAREMTEESEDPLNLSHLGDNSVAMTDMRSQGEDDDDSELSEGTASEDTETETEDEEEDVLGLDEPEYAEEEDENYEDEEADDEKTGVSEQESSFAISTESEPASDGDTSESESPVRRATTKRRTTGSPVKPSNPAPRNLSPKKPNAASKSGVSPTKRNGNGNHKRTSSVKPSKKTAVSETDSPASSPLPVPRPLREKFVQESTGEDEDEEEEEVVQPAKAKKKRTLGKKVMTEDEMVAAENKVAGAEVRRLVKGGL